MGMPIFSSLDSGATLTRLASYGAAAQYDLAVATALIVVDKAEVEAIKSRLAAAEIGIEIVRLLAKAQYP